jgi:Recombination endonuclease VII
VKRCYHLTVGTCLACTRSYNKEYHEKHKVSANAARREKYAADLTYRAAQRASVKQYSAAHPEKARTLQQRKALKNPQGQRNRGLRYRYGAEADKTYERLYDEQGGRCAICRRTPNGAMHVDHDHTTGQIRQLLCRSCNIGLGHFRDNPVLLRAAADYIEKHEQVEELAEVIQLRPHAGDVPCSTNG